jgi:hypothetical protein
MKQYKDRPINALSDIQAPPPTPDDGSIQHWNRDMSAQVRARLQAGVYEDEVINVLEAIDRPGLGRLLIAEFPTTRQITIYPPNQKVKNRGGDTNAWAVPTDQKKSLARGVVMFIDPSNALTEVDGEGGGSNVFIYFDPFARTAGCTGNPTGRQCLSVEPNEVLLHELVHALRDAEGIETNQTWSMPQQRYDNLEEFMAILLTNIYSSERGKTKFRQDHQDDATPLKDAWATSEGFLTDKLNNWGVGKFCTDHDALATAIAGLNISFNPVRVFKARQRGTP